MTFPISETLLSEAAKTEFDALFERLMDDFRRNSVVKQRKDGVEYQEFYPSASKPIIDEIDRVLARHYGFTDAELDFILHYDIKYRMGRDTESDAEGDDNG